MSAYSPKVKYARDTLSSMFPDMPEEDYRALVDDIRENKQLDPILVRGRSIIDGWHRYRACLELEVEPFMVEYDEELDGPADKLVLSRNLFRRQLSTEDRIRLAIEALGYVPGQKGRAKGKATAQAVATVAKVSEKSVQRFVSPKTAKPVKEKSAPTLEGLLKREKMLLGQLESVRAQISELSPEVKPGRVKRRTR